MNIELISDGMEYADSPEYKEHKGDMSRIYWVEMARQESVRWRVVYMLELAEKQGGTITFPKMSRGYWLEEK